MINGLIKVGPQFEVGKRKRKIVKWLVEMVS